jgi:hypothetical protein
MKLKSCVCLILLLVLTFLVSTARADTHSTFETTRYYSYNRKFFVEVTEKKRATLYRNGSWLRRIWRRTLPELPRHLMVSNDGKRAVIIDKYYGNGGQPSLKVITTLDERGGQLVSLELREVANLSRVLQTTSAAHWYGGAEFSPDGRFLIVKTVVAKRQCSEITKPPEEPDECMQSVPYEQLRFDLASGKLIERASLASQ